MVDSDDEEAPEGYERPVNRRMMKAPPPEARSDVDVGASLDDAAAAAKALSSPPASPSHGRPKGANNALAFHAFKKAPKPDADR